MDSILQDIRFAFRSLRRSPVFTAVAVLTIAIGIGAPTTIFSVANAILLRPPDGLRQANDLVTVHSLAKDGSSFHSFSYPIYTELRDAGSDLSSLSGFGIFFASLSSENEPRLLLGMVVTGEYFQTLGTRPFLGRLFVSADDRGAAGADALVVLSHRIWIRRFSGDSAIIGQTVVLNRQPFTVIGVAEPGFQGHLAALDVGLWVPMGIFPLIGDVARLDEPNSLPLNLGNQQTVIRIGGRDPTPNVGLFQTDFAAVTPDYFQTMEIGLLAGRDFAPSDVPESPGVAIVNQTLADLAWPDQDPLGKTFTLGGPADAPVEIIGLARNSKVRSLGESAVPLIYLPFNQSPSSSLTIIARGQRSDPAIGGLIRQAIHQADPALPLLTIAPLEEIIGVSLLPNRIAATLASLLGGIGLILATVGLYGLLSFTVTRRRREIGVRMALGAQAWDVMQLILRQGLRMTLTGLVLGFGVALATTRLLQSLLFGLSPVDPLTFGTIILLLGLTAAIACLVPAVRATRTDPMVAIRHD